MVPYLTSVARAAAFGVAHQLTGSYRRAILV